MDCAQEINLRLQAHLDAVHQLEEVLPEIERAVMVVTNTFLNKKKVLLAGNGGSAADAQHWATEWTIRLSHELNRPAMPALALTTDTSALTAGGNDIGFANIFARQVEALGNDGDLLVVISTSGNSENLIQAVKMAKERKLSVLGILGKNGGALAPMCDHAVVVPAEDTQRIQEMHAFIGHMLCELSEIALYG